MVSLINYVLFTLLFNVDFRVNCSGGGLLAINGGQRSPATAYADAGPLQGDDQCKKKKVVVLGTGWAGVSFLKNLKDPSYDVHVVSPHNYFAFTPLLPSVTCGTVEARSIVEPVRCIAKKVMCVYILQEKERQ